ncbi:unnamed protein product [Trichogramma brassicae]|uniref:Reverse transcriptase zinc-binding domain-containing protein n=1 Tax=Trichogramma brassicae TaxID=86971 RepID=A0A6H5I8R1_9HYME|nr:unnamed protein product [Trichogramma brassicae]
MDWLTPDHFTTQFLAGHGNFRYKLASLKLVDSAMCECGEIETCEHVLNECPRYQEEKEKAIRNLQEDHLVMSSMIATRQGFEIFRDVCREILTKKEEEDRRKIRNPE